MPGAFLAAAAAALLVCPMASAGESAPAAGGGDKSKPLAIFVGDSITVGTNVEAAGLKYKLPDPLPTPRFTAGRYSYVEALYEATRAKPAFRIDKNCSGGQGISGQYSGLKIACRQIFEKRWADVKELPAFLVLQDFEVQTTDADRKANGDALREIAAMAAKVPQVKFVASTVATEPGGMWSATFKPEDIKATNETLIKTAEELKLPLIRLDTAWERYFEFAKDKKPAAAWRLTQVGKLYDGVHPGPVGILFQALVFARELGVPAEGFDENAASLGLPKEQTAEIKKFVYSWKEPTVVPLPEAPKGNEPAKP